MNSNIPPVQDQVHVTQVKSTNVHVPTPKFFMPVFLTVIISTLIYIGFQLSADLSHVPALNLYSLILLATALFIALGFEFVNGFHDTANAVATVIYTNALSAPVAVMWAGFCNFLGVMVASGAVAYGIIALLPVELIMNVSSGAGFAMVFAMLIAAILWNLGTWFLGIPASSSHTLIGSILGVGIMNYLMHSGSGASGVDMDQVIKVGKALLFSPMIGFAFAAVLFLLVKKIFKKQLELFQPPVAVLKEKLGANLLTQVPEIAQWLVQNPHQLDLAAIAYLDGEKHVRVSVAMDAIMQYVSAQKADTSLMYMCTPTDVYAVPEEVITASEQKFSGRSKTQQMISKSISTLSGQLFFKKNLHELIESDNTKSYGIADCLVIEQGPNYALAKRIQQWRATLARSEGQRVSINIAPSTTTHSVTKNPLLKAAFNGASLFDVEAFKPATTNAIMAALWIHDLRNPESVANPENKLEHPLELMMHGANHGGLWRVAYLARTALPFAALYGFAADKLPLNKVFALLKK
jgi:phosphate/sulfate permease